MLFPSDSFNEKFLIRMRDCVINLRPSHPLKIWMKNLGRKAKENKINVMNREFLVEVLNSPFNLITEVKTRNKIIDLLTHIPDVTVPEKLLRSYLYLILGNISRSDNILKNIVNNPPIYYWLQNRETSSFYHQLSIEHTEKIFQKFSKHPTDRKSFQLLILYLKNFFNEEALQETIREYDTTEVESKLELKSIESFAPMLINYLRLLKIKLRERVSKISEMNIDVKDQLYWILPFIEIEPIISQHVFPELLKLEKSDELWFIYLMSDERLFDIFSAKKGKSFLPGRRHFLKRELENPSTFMLSLYKLIEFGDFGAEIVYKVSERSSYE